MNLEDLNKLRIDDLGLSGQYDEIFRLQLTAKHALIVGKWENDGESGVDLRRWSYDQGRLLGAGITLDISRWHKLYDFIYELNEKDVFAHYGSVDQSVYEAEFRESTKFTLVTTIFAEGRIPYLCITLNKAGSPVWKARGTLVGIIIRFDTISDFIAKSESLHLAPKRETPKTKKKRKIDGATGREIL